MASFIFPTLFIPVTGQTQNVSYQTFDNYSPGGITPRTDLESADYGMTTRNGAVELLLTHENIVIQFSEEKLDVLKLFRRPLRQRNQRLHL